VDVLQAVLNVQRRNGDLVLSPDFFARIMTFSASGAQMTCRTGTGDG
jgi:hypothetical protein